MAGGCDGNFELPFPCALSDSRAGSQTSADTCSGQDMRADVAGPPGLRSSCCGRVGACVPGGLAEPPLVKSCFFG